MSKKISLPIKYNHFINLIILLVSSYLCSQTTVSGTINDEANQPISFANIILKAENAQSIVAFSYSDNNGKYSLKTIKKGKYLLQFSGLSYKTLIVPLDITDENMHITQNVNLNYLLVALNEVNVNAERPITIKKDTIVFNAQSFTIGNEQVVEDLLRRIPGLSISSDGTIKAGNQEVEKVMIDGDDFFEKGYKILTKNMPSHSIDKVELLQHYSNNKHLKGVENSDKVALNLKLKEDAKRQWFGNFSASHDLVSKKRYELKSNLMNFGKNNKYYFLTNLNNVGKDVTGDINQLIRPFRWNEPASIGDNQNGFSLLDLSTYVPNLKPKRVLFNNAELVSLNAIFTLSEKVKIKTLGFFNSDENDFYRNSFQSFSILNTTFENTEDFTLQKKKINGFGKIDFTYDISKNKTLEYIGKYNNTNEKNRSDLTFNGDLFNEKLHSNNQLFDQKIVFTNKLNDHKVILLTARYINEKTPQNYSVNQFLFSDLFSENANNTVQTSENKMQFAGFEAHLMDKKTNGSLFELQIGNQFRTDNLIASFLLKENETVIAQPLGYQNKIRYSVNDLYLKTKYRYKYKNYSFNTQLELHQLYNQLKTTENNQNQQPFFVNPRIGMAWEINKTNKISTSYSYNTTNASILEMFNQYLLTSFRSFDKGTGTFNQLDASTIILNYQLGSWDEKFFATAFLMYNKNHDFFSTNSTISQNFIQSEKIIIKDREYITFSSNIDRYFKPISSNLKVTFEASKSNYKNIVNNSSLREVKVNNLNYGFEIRSGFSGIFNYHIGTKWTYNAVETTAKNTFTDNFSFLDVSFVFSDKFNLQFKTERYFFGSLDNNSNSYNFLDVEAKYTVKENKLTFSFSGNNLFNTKTFKNYSISDISISKSAYRILPRFLLLKMEYRF